MYTAYVQVFIGQLVTNMLSTHKERKTGSAIPLQARRFRGPFINCVWKVTDYGSNRATFKGTLRLALEKNTNFNKGVWAIGRSGSHLLLLML